MSTIGSRIRDRREKLGLSQDELSKRLGYKSRSSINKIELDERNLTQSKIKAIADALGTTPAYIMGWEEEQKKNDALADIVAKMRKDEIFLTAVEKLYQLDKEKLKSISQMLDAFLK